jgi:hypothetical protein
MKHAFFKPLPKYCPSSLSKQDIDLFNQVASCSSVIFEEDKDLLDKCLKFKGCISCPEHG